MTSLLLVLTPIALIDSLSMVPMSLVPVALILGGKRALISAAAFVAGILVAYISGGLVLLYFLDAIIDYVSPGLMRWLHDPTNAELVVQFFIGLILIALAWPSGKSNGKPKQSNADESLSPAGWFIVSFLLVFGGLPGALPYIGGIDQILRAELSRELEIAAILFYNLVCVSPIVALFLVPRLFPASSEALFSRITTFFETWGPRLLTVAVILIGLVLAIDAVLFIYFGYPLLPIFPPETQS